jgi:predicted permease
MLQLLRARLLALWHWKRQESELDEELEFHLSEEEDERSDAGLPADQARLAARRDFGNLARIREETRDEWGWRGAERLIQDVRYGVRTMRRHPSFAVLAVLTLALGIGATTAILHVVNALVLRSLPFDDADRIVVLFATTPTRGIYRDTTSFLDFSAWQQESHAFADAAAYRQEPFTITGDGEPAIIPGLRASHELLNVLGARPVLGRAFDAEEQHGNHPVVIISHRLWTGRYNSDPGILSKPIVLSDMRYSVVGVLPPEFRFPAFNDIDVIVPVPERTCRSCGYLRGVARLKPAVSASAAQRELDAIASGLERAFPASNEGRGVSVVPLHEVAVGPVRPPLFLLLGAGICVLLIGCANVGNLVLANGIARQRELAVRSALGAGRGRLVRQLLTESVSLALIAALLGALLASWGSAFLVASLSLQFRLPEISSNPTLVVFACSLAILSGVLSGLPPALMAWKSNMNDALKQHNRGQSAGMTEHRLGRLLIAGETALTVMLLISAGLLAKSFITLQQIDLGANTQPVLTADLLLSKRYAEPQQRDIYVARLLESIVALPGVEAVGLHVDPPFQGGGRRETFSVEGHEDPRPDTGHPAGFNIVSGAFFQAMDIPVIRGRAFTPQDTAASAPVAIINETMARQFWPHEAAIGKRVRFFYDKDRARWWSIVGVVREMRYRGRLVEPVPQVFIPGEQPFYKAQEPFVSVVVRTSGEPGALLNAVRAAIWSVDNDQPISNLQPMDRVIRESAAAPRVYMQLLGIFASIALVIAGAGIYGLSAYAVGRRTQEIGIRLALGARPVQVLVMVLRQSMHVIMVGIAAGVAGALALSKVTAGFLFGISATDGPTFLAVVLLFAGIAFVSTYIPARRAAAIDPTLAFRAE